MIYEHCLAGGIQIRIQPPPIRADWQPVTYPDCLPCPKRARLGPKRAMTVRSCPPVYDVKHGGSDCPDGATKNNLLFHRSAQPEHLGHVQPRSLRTSFYSILNALAVSSPRFPLVAPSSCCREGPRLPAPDRHPPIEVVVRLQTGLRDLGSARRRRPGAHTGSGQRRT